MLLRPRQYPEKALYNKGGKMLLSGEDLSFKKVFEDTLQPIWDYRREDRIIGMEIRSLLKQLYAVYEDGDVRHFLLQME